jgi:hypothetical protein
MGFLLHTLSECPGVCRLVLALGKPLGNTTSSIDTERYQMIL